MTEPCKKIEVAKRVLSQVEAHDLLKWEERKIDGGLVLELKAGDAPALVLVQGENRITVPLTDVKHLVAALTDAAANLAEVLAAGGVYHA